MSNSNPSDQSKTKPSSVRHTRAIQRDRTKRPPTAPPDGEVEARLQEMIHPATLAQVHHYAELGLRERTLSLPIMVTLVVSLIWRQLGSVADLVRVLQTEGVLGADSLKVSQQAVSQRLRSLPAPLFERVLMTVLPQVHRRWQARQRRLPPEVAWARERYTAVLAHDGSTLDALLRQVGLLRDEPKHPLGGRMTALLDLCTRLPQRIWYDADAAAHDSRAWPEVQGALTSGALLLFDLGFIDFGVFAQLTAQSVSFITRAKSNLAYPVEAVLQRTASVHDSLV